MTALWVRGWEKLCEPKHHYIALPEVQDLLLLHIRVPDITEQDHHCGAGPRSVAMSPPTLPLSPGCGTSAEDQRLLVMEKEFVSSRSEARRCRDPALDVIGSDHSTASVTARLTPNLSEREHLAGLLS